MERYLSLNRWIWKIKMGFENRNFSTPIEIEESFEENKFIIIACEGKSTEPQYFNYINTIAKKTQKSSSNITMNHRKC